MLDKVNLLVDAGFSVIPLKPRSKRPVAANWTELPTHTRATLARAYRDGQNLGVRLGEPSIVEGLHLYTIDLDVRLDECADEAWAALKALFPKVKFSRLPTVQSGSGGESRHIYFLCDGLFRSHKLAHSGEKFTDDAGKKHWTWEIEFFGTGKQVALPPSIHPDTGKPYVWIKPPDSVIGIPEIDAEVIEDLIASDDEREPVDREPIDMTLDQAEDALAEIADWADDRDTWMRVGMGLKFNFGDEDGWDLFDSWSKNRGNYVRRVNREQWNSYTNDRKNPVTFRTALAEAHQRIRQRQIRDAVNMFEDLEDELDDDDDADFEVGANRLTYSEVVSKIDVPEHLLSIPGKLQMAVDYYNTTSLTTQPQFAVQAAIALGSVVLGRNHTTDQDNPAMLYLLSVGGTGAGKETIKRVVRKILRAADLNKLLIGPRYYTSDAGVFWQLTGKPRHFTFLDEFGKRMGDDKGDHMKEGVYSAYLEVFGAHDDDYQPAGYSQKGNTKEEVERTLNSAVTRPSLTLCGASTPSTFYDAISSKDVANGLINRFIIVESQAPDQEQKTRIPPTDIPRELIDWVDHHAHACGEGQDDMLLRGEGSFHDLVEPREVPFTEAAHKLIDKLESKKFKLIQKYTDQGVGELFVRTRENAQRLALIVAISDGSDVVSASHLQWAWDYVRYYHEKTAKAFLANAGKTDLQRLADQVETIILKAGKNGLTQYEIGRKYAPFKSSSERDAREVMDRLARVGGITEQKIKTKGSTRLAFVHPKHL